MEPQFTNQYSSRLPWKLNHFFFIISKLLRILGENPVYVPMTTKILSTIITLKNGYGTVPLALARDIETDVNRNHFEKRIYFLTIAVLKAPLFCDYAHTVRWQELYTISSRCPLSGGLNKDKTCIPSAIINEISVETHVWTGRNFYTFFVLCM